MNKKIVVTGVNGTLSKAVAQWLRGKNDNYVTQVSLRDDKWKIDGFNGVDCIVHIAGVTPKNAKSTDDYEKINNLLTRDLAQHAKADGVRQFVYISSMAVYGMSQLIDSEKGMVRENTPCSPCGEYGISKLRAEEYLHGIGDNNFAVAIIRVPSIYGKGMTEYLDQYKYLADKLPLIPYMFEDNYKSAIYIDNLCELIYLIIENSFAGLICPDDGRFAAVDFCSAIYPLKKRSKLLGKLIGIFLRNNARIVDYYGAIYYSDALTNVFDGKYRVVPFIEAVRRTYEE